VKRSLVLPRTALAQHSVSLHNTAQMRSVSRLSPRYKHTVRFTQQADKALLTKGRECSTARRKLVVGKAAKREEHLSH
jgi:Flp pilus assembly CpaE family ATPase